MTRYLTADQVGRINERNGGGGLQGADRGGVEAAVARPHASFDGLDLHVSLWDKAGALLDGLSSTQHFIDGNKRTAWLSAVTFLRLNGVRLPVVPDIESEAFVLAVATVHSFDVPKAAEWLESIYRRWRPGYTADPRLEYLFLAGELIEDDPSLLNVVGAHVHGLVATVLPAPHLVTLVTRIHWRPLDQGPHVLSAAVQDGHDGRVLRPLTSWSMTLSAPFIGGHAHQVDQIVPVIAHLALPMSAIKPGASTIIVSIDGVDVGRVPLLVTLTPDVPDVLPFALAF